MSASNTNTGWLRRHRTTMIILCMSSLFLGLIIYSELNQHPELIYNFYQQYSSLPCGKCDNKLADTYDGWPQLFNYTSDNCMSGYVQWWEDNWKFQCVTPSNAKSLCYDKYPQEYVIIGTDLYKRNVYIDNNFNSTICVSKVMDGTPLDLQAWLKSQNSTQVSIRTVEEKRI